MCRFGSERGEVSAGEQSQVVLAWHPADKVRLIFFSQSSCSSQFYYCTDPRAKEKFQQISIAYTKLISSRSNGE
jgi:hypothetical protein